MCQATSCTDPASHSATGASGQSSFSAAFPKEKPSQCLLQQSPYLNIKSTYKYFSLIYLSSHRSVGSSGLQPPGLPPKTPQGLNTGAVPGENHGFLCSGVLVSFVNQELMHLYFPLTFGYPKIFLRKRGSRPSHPSMSDSCQT